MSRGFKADTFGNIYPLDQAWLWLNRIPTGELTILAAAGGTGKGLLSAWLISAITNGWPLPDGGPAVPGQGVLWASVEDDAHITMVNRLIASGANADMVGNISQIHGRNISLPDDMAQLAEAVANQGNTGLIVLDPLTKIASNSVGTRNNTNRVMEPLQQYANETGIPIVMVHHVNRDGDVNGSKAVKDSVRSVLLLEREKNQPNIRKLVIDKTNGGDEDAPDLSFTIEGDGSDVHIKWISEPDDNSADGLNIVAKAIANHDGLTSAQMVTRETGIPYGTARVMLARLASQRRIRDMGNDWYGAESDA
jgi:AAA domain